MRCFILGNGSSLNDVDLTLLKDEATFGCNRIYLKWSDMGYPVTNYFLIDTYFCSSLRLEVQPYLDRGVKKFFVKHHSDRYMHSDKVHVGEGFISVGEGMLTYAAEMGYDQIYLLGIDMDYSGLKQRLGAERGVTVPPPQKANGFSRWMNAIYLYIPMIYLLLCLADIATKTPAYIS